MNRILLSASLIVSMMVFGQEYRPAPTLPSQPAFETGEYRNMFVESGKSAADVSAKLDAAWNMYFVNGDYNSERLYYEVGDDMAYIKDVASNDVRSEGMSYGMMICVQLNKRDEFDKLWKFAKEYTQHKPGTPEEGLFSWQVSTHDFTMIDPNSAPDGEEYFVTALFFAHSRWGSAANPNGFNPATDIYDYKGQANYILNSMINKQPSGSGCPTNIINLEYNQITFGMCGESSTFTDPSYHLPAFYDIWAMEADHNNELWTNMANTSRGYLLPQAAHPVTGLMPGYANFDGSPNFAGGGTHAYYERDSWRNIMNMSVDMAWFGKSKHTIQPIISNQINFFSSHPNYASVWELDGSASLEGGYHEQGLITCNATAALALEDAKVWAFVDEFYNMARPDGLYRYYNGLLYMMNFMHLAGEFRIYVGDPQLSSGSSAASSSSSSASVPNGAYTYLSIPGTIEAEDFNTGGQGAAYNDHDAVNHGGEGRTGGVDIGWTGDQYGWYDIGWTGDGEWLTYTVADVDPGTYNIVFRVSSALDGYKSIIPSLSGVSFGQAVVPNTGGWGSYVDVTIPNVQITDGNANQVMHLYIVGGGFNFNYVRFDKIAGPKSNGFAALKDSASTEAAFTVYPNPSFGQVTITFSDADAVDTVAVYDMTGRVVKQLDSIVSKDVRLDGLTTGVYMVDATVGGKKIVEKLIVK